MSMDVVTDLKLSLKNWHLWGLLALYDIRQRYRRSVIGPFWITISVGVFIAALGTVYSFLFKMSISEYLPYLATGYIVWTLISATISEGCQVFVDNGSVIKQINTPYSVFALRLVWRNFLIFLHNLPILMGVFLVFGVWPGWSIFLALAGIIVALFNAVWAVIILGVICARFRDIAPIIMTFLQVVLFVTPIMWKPEMLGAQQWMAHVNIFYHFVEIVRAPLLGAPATWWSYGSVAIMTVLNAMLAYWLFKRCRSRIVYWV
jgi:lipopolysaccharide transport system permease protein